MKLMSKKEWIIFASLVGSLTLMGLVTGGIKDMLMMGCFGLIVWGVWRGRKL